jgi:hypothetical protein
MRRRRFFKALAVLPAAPALMPQQATPPGNPQIPAVTPPEGGRGGRGGGGGRFGAGNIPKFEQTAPDAVGRVTQRFFTSPQWTALRKLSEVLMPPMRGNPGAIECGAPEFLDFLIGASPADRQHLYRNGLDMLNTRAKKQFNKSFAELDTAQADATIRPLLVAVPWVHDAPRDPNAHFIAEAHRDIRTATQNSREWAEASAASGRRGGFGGGGGSYINPIDPIYKG